MIIADSTETKESRCRGKRGAGGRNALRRVANRL